ncbi:unnamed protein product [Chrysodeixis includens]|uniref:Uncharacterized protein n=1 Tax=Chrysodeixis includens TaxID=689277 RepID=A0A9N8KRR2_CHRIL|nr:unnamed protein product [Chrysodeixis includens]
MQYSLADLDAIYRDPENLVFDIDPQEILEQGMIESQEVLDGSMFESRETHNHLLDSDDSKDEYSGETPVGLHADNFDIENMDIDVQADTLPDNKPSEPDFGTD